MLSNETNGLLDSSNGTKSFAVVDSSLSSSRLTPPLNSSHSSPDRAVSVTSKVSESAVSVTVSDNRSQVSAAGNTDIVQRQIQWDKEAASADQKQAELFHMQWSLFRDQMSTFSSEVISMRYEIKNLQIAEAQNRQDIVDAAAERREMMEKFEKMEASVRTIHEEIEGVRHNLQGESAQRRNGDESLKRDLDHAEDRLNAAMLDVRRQCTSTQEALDVERRERTNNEEHTRVKIGEVLTGVEEERSQRIAECEALDQEFQRLRSALDEESRKRTAGDSALESTLQSMIGDLSNKLDQESKARSVGDARLEKSLEDETAGRRNDVMDLTGTLRELRSSLDQEVRKREESDENVARTISKLSTSLEKEVRDRTAGDEASAHSFKDMRAALEQERHDRVEGDEALRRSVTNEEKLREQAHARVQDEIKDLRNNMLTESQARAGADDELRRITGELRKALDEQVKATTSSIERLTLQQKDLNRDLDKERAERLAAEEHLREADAQLLRQLQELKLVVDLLESKCEPGLERLDKRCAELRSSLAELLGRSEELERGIGALRHGLDQEERTRADKDSEITSIIRQMQHEIDHNGSERNKILADLGERLDNLNAKMVAEARDRKAGDDEVMKSLLQLHQLIEKEASERRAKEEELAQRLQGISSDLQQQVALVAQLRTGLDDERRARKDGDERLGEQVQDCLKQIKELQHNLEREVGERRTICEQLERQLLGLRDKDAELARHLQEIRNALEVENNARAKAVLELSDRIKHLSELRDLIEKEASERRVNEEELSHRLQGVSAALQQQSVELRTGLEDERRTRKDGDERLGEQVQDCSKRCSDNAAAIAQQTKDLRMSLDKEGGDRKTTCEQLERHLADVREKEAELAHQLQDARRKLDLEANKLESEIDARTRATAELSDRIMSVSGALSTTFEQGIKNVQSASSFEIKNVPTASSFEQGIKSVQSFR